MKVINILGINLEGFRTWSEPSSFAFDHTGVHIITGKNGSGKSSLFAALTWALYGVNLFDTNQGNLLTLEHLRGPKFKGCRVVVTLNIGKTIYKVARHYKFKGVTFGVAGEGLLIFKKDRSDESKFNPAHLVTEESYTKDSQKYLTSELVPFELFMQSVLFGQRMKRFFEDSQETKRTVLESLIDLSFVDAAKAKCTERVTELSDAVNSLTLVVNNLTNEIEKITGQIESEKSKEAQYEGLMKQQRINLKSHHETLVGQLESAQTRLEEVSAKLTAMNVTRVADHNLTKKNAEEALRRAEGRKNTTVLEMNTLKRDIAENNGKITALKVPVKTKCNTCGSDLDAKGVKAAQDKQNNDIAVIEKINMSLEKKWTEHNNSMELLDKDITDARVVFDAAALEYSKAFEAAQQRSGIESQVRGLQAEIEQIENTIENVVAKYKATKQPYKPTVDVDRLAEKIEQHKLAIEKSTAELATKNTEIEALNWWLSQFKVGGIKSFMFSTMLDSFNQALANYKDVFGIEARFSIDEKKANKAFVGEVVIENTVLNYFDLSGGQKTKADLLICFAYADLLESTVSFNLQLFDEPTTFMDADSASLFDTIVRMRAKEKAVYLITHETFVDTSGDGVYVYNVTGGLKTPSKIES